MPKGRKKLGRLPSAAETEKNPCAIHRASFLMRGLQTWRHFDVCEIVPKSGQFFDRASGVRIDACLGFWKSTAFVKYYSKCFFWLQSNGQRYKERVSFSWGFSKKKASFMWANVIKFRLAIRKHRRMCCFKQHSRNCNLLNTSLPGGYIERLD